MIFFDTNIWIELLAVRTPEKEHEIKQARLASNLLKDVLSSKCKILPHRARSGVRGSC